MRAFRFLLAKLFRLLLLAPLAGVSEEPLLAIGVGCVGHGHQWERAQGGKGFAFTAVSAVPPYVQVYHNKY